MTLNEFRKNLGMKTISDIFGTEDPEELPSWAIEYLSELDVRFMRTEVRIREDGLKEAVVYIPFKIEGL